MTQDQPTSGTLTTTLQRKWLIKMSVFTLAMAILGLWGLYDAKVKYPASGMDDAEYKLKVYLATADKEGRLNVASIPDPTAELARLEEGLTSETEKARIQYLTALELIASLDEIKQRNQGGAKDSETVFSDPAAKLKELSDKWQSRQVPTTLSKYDIPVQWLFAISGIGVTVYMLLFLIRCAGVKYRYNPVEKRLTTPKGISFTPSDIAEVDRRLWHKFYVELKLNDGQLVKLDLLRFSPLEEWFLEMEKLAPGYVPPAPETPAEPASAAPGDPSPTP